MYKFTDSIAKRNSRGFLVPVVGTVTVNEAGTSTLATLYADDETTPLDNPIATNADGMVQFKIANGIYDIVANDGVAEYRITDFIATDVVLGNIGQEVSSDISTVVTCATAFPVDDSVPQNTEGTEVVTRSITPASASSVLEITYTLTGSATGTMFVGAAVFVDSEANALSGSSSLEQTTGGNQKVQMSWTFRVAAGSTDARTYKLRVGPSTGTFYINGDNTGSRLLGGNSKAQLIVREVLPS